MTFNRRAPGIALMIVLVVVSLLVLIAMPFVATMLFHERSSRTQLDRAHTFFGAEGTKNFAIAQAYRTHDSTERRFGSAPFNTPYRDTLDEFRVALRDSRLGGRLETANPEGMIWGARVQDEQGKINL